MNEADSFRLHAQEIGPVPLVRHFFDRLRLDDMLAAHVPDRKLGRRSAVSSARAISVMVANVLISRGPLYSVPEWLQRHIPEQFGLDDGEAKAMNDDRIGRALDRLYQLDPAALLTAVVTRAVKEFAIDLSQIHSDTTTVTFDGSYDGQAEKAALHRPPMITFGHNKDHRPDLKQLVYSLAVSADGAVPVHHKIYDGNTGDEQTHIETWSVVKEIAGTAKFVYVADSKLCTRENMRFIDEHGGTFLTVLPRSRQEDDAFRHQLQEHAMPWREVRRRKDKSGKDRPDVVHEAYEPGERSAEGYRIVWYRSSVKTALDAKRRKQRIKRARMRLTHLEMRTGAHRFRSVEAAQRAADEVLQEEGAQKWLAVRAYEEAVTDFEKVTPGRQRKGTRYRKVHIPIVLLEVNELADVIRADARCDGIFAMVTNDGSRSPEQLLEVYKYQPFLEKRNEQLKSVLCVAPVFLKRPERVAALLLVYFLALLVFALVEHEARRAMRDKGIASLPLYPEGRPCKAPTADLVMRAFEGLRRSQLRDEHGNTLRTFHDPLSKVATKLLKLLHVSPAHFGA
jgi:transposase